MRVTLKELLQNYGVRKLLSAYETNPWLMYDENKEITCSAEVRMGPNLSDLEAEIQFLYDDPEKAAKTNPEQILIMRALPLPDGRWSPKSLFIKGENYHDKIGGWDEKGCKFFLACIQSIQMNELPDVDALIEKELSEDKGGSGRRGRIGRKSPQINSSAVMGMKK